MLHLSSLRRGFPATLNALMPEPEQPLSRLHDHRAQRVSPLQTKPLEDDLRAPETGCFHLIKSGLAMNH